MPVHRRPVELRLHLLREGAHLLRVDRESARPAGRHPGEARQNHPKPTRSGGAAADQGARQEAGRGHGRDGRDQSGGSRALYARADRGVGVLPVHLDAGHLQFRVRRPPRAPGLSRLHQPRVAAPRGSAPGGRVEPDRKEDPLIRPDLRVGQGPPRHQRGQPHGHAAAHPAAARRIARREPGDRRLGVGRVRDREGLVRPDHRRVRASRGAHCVSRGRQEHRNLGVAFYKTGMLDEAAREFRRVAELRPGEANAHFYIGLVALKQARWREAMEALRQAAEKGGGRPAVLHNLGFAYEQLGRLDEAEGAYGEAAARARTDAKVYLGWGVVALKRGDYGGAAGRLDRARELFGKAPPPAWFWARALAAAGAGEFEQAQDLADEGAEAYPSHAALQNNLAVLKELSGDLTGAEDLVRAARKNEPSLPQLSKNLGDLAYRGSRYDEAWEAYSRAIELAPDLGDDVYFKLGNIAYKRNSRELAAQLWRKALEINPKHELVKANLDTLSALS